MRSISLLILIFCIAATGWSAERKFPYEAAVEVAEEFVRSGGGQNFYPTSKVRRGDKVTVHRHDAGGWAMISPPPGSFSWIEARYVKRQQGNVGALTASNVIARVGSEFNDDHSFYQVELSKGQTVEILGEKNLEDERGTVAVLKIKPPANEFRWIPGRALRSAEAPVLQPLQQDHVAAQPEMRQPAPTPTPLKDKQADPFADGPMPAPIVDDHPVLLKQEPASPPETARGTKTEQAGIEEFQGRINAIDEQFRTIVQKEPPEWNLTGIEQQYRELDESTDSYALKSKVKLRLDAVKRYAKTREEYEEFARITAETKQRDAQLASMTNSPQGHVPANSRPAAPLPTSAAPKPEAAAPAPAAPLRFDGAGVVQRAPGFLRGAPQFALFAPNGRMLAYLQPAPGVNLNSYVGKTMGILGQRSYRPELQTELIIVRSLQPVRLKGG